MVKYWVSLPANKYWRGLWRQNVLRVEGKGGYKLDSMLDPAFESFKATKGLVKATLYALLWTRGLKRLFHFG
jgi:hypothetical protein